MPNKAPAFQFYANDWLSSPRIMLMSPAQEGAYIRLLCIAWNDPDCSIPDDDAQLAILSRLGEGWLKGGSTLVRECFNQHPEKPGRLVNLRLLEERAKQQNWREKSRQGGIESGKIRRNQALTKQQQATKGGSRVVEPKGNSSSSSPSSINPQLQPKVVIEGASRAKTRSARRPKICDEEYLEELQRNPAYAVFDVKAIYHKMAAWCQVKGKEPTRSRLVNWLNREDRPMAPQSIGEGNGKSHQSKPIHRETHNERAARETAELIAASLAASDSDSNADPADAGAPWIAADFRRV